MTHYDVDYSTLEGRAKTAKALRDIRQYMGIARFHKVVKLLRKNGMPHARMAFVFHLSFAGIAGYPAHALYEWLWPTQNDMHVFDWHNR